MQKPAAHASRLRSGLAALGVSLGVVLCGPAALAQGGTPQSAMMLDFEQPVGAVASPPEHFVIAQLRNALRPWLSAQEQQRLDAISAEGTALGNATSLRYLAADRALRAFVPLAMELVERPRAAARLRQLAPVVDRRSSQAALRDRSLLDAAHHREELARQAAENLARAMVRRGSQVRVQDIAGDARELAADRALLAAADAVQGRESADVAETVAEALHSSGDAQQREAVFVLVFGLVRDLADLARNSREPVVVYRQPSPESLGDPEADPVRRSALRDARRGVSAAQTPGVRGVCSLEYACGMRAPQ